MSIKVEYKAPLDDEPFISESGLTDFFNKVKQESGQSDAANDVAQEKRDYLRFKKLGGKRRQDMFYEKSRHCVVKDT